ncbi:hypothetical protein JOF56_005898 [Kibdelosporangium banguiense]|uniref:DUF3558 domain-containing protein n=1 Tax=Kibdelosporangium banguiense TaxID=1365924 RepID=A0ABS4TM73_9PSEU|nr:hypothetical protein [Kibdelosporangium banguiense]MBP2325513.1 hypothetical protein [Kibdelosporangium banguiense]
MADLRTELETYASADEPPMRMTFDEVFTAARRKRQRHRSLTIAGGVAVLAAAAVAVPVVFTTAATPPPPIGPAAPPSLGSGCPPPAEKEAQLRCVFDKFLAKETPGTPWQKTKTKILGPTRGAYAVTDRNDYVQLNIVTRDSDPKDTCKTMSTRGPCEQRVGPHGETVLVFDHDPGKPGSPHMTVRVQSGRSEVTMDLGGPTPTKRILDANQMIRLATTPELLP